MNLLDLHYFQNKDNSPVASYAGNRHLKTNVLLRTEMVNVSSIRT